MSIISRIALTLLIIGGINWGLIGFMQFDLVATIFGGQDAVLSRIIYGLVGISALACLALLFTPSEELNSAKNQATRFSNPNYNTEFGKEHDFSKERDAKKK